MSRSYAMKKIKNKNIELIRNGVRLRELDRLNCKSRPENTFYEYNVVDVFLSEKKDKITKQYLVIYLVIFQELQILKNLYLLQEFFPQ